MRSEHDELARSLSEMDRLIHEPARLLIMSILAAVEGADFLYLQRETGLSKGNLSSHLTRLESAGYVKIEKTYRGKIPLTLCCLTSSGQSAFAEYRKRWKAVLEQWE